MTKGKDPRQEILEVKMPYISGLSSNHYKFFGGRYTKPEVKDWMRALKEEIYIMGLKNLLNRTPQVKVFISGTFKDKRSCPDIHNLVKIILDSIAPALGMNDRDIEVNTGIPKIVKREYGIFCSRKVNLQATGEILIKLERILL